MKHGYRVHSALADSQKTTVPRHMVHRHAISEVFLTDAAELAPGRYQCAIQFPRTNSYFNDNPCQSYDMILLIEVFRQAAIYVSHAWLGADMTAKFMYLASDTSISRPEALNVGRVPTNAVIDITLREDRARHGHRQGAMLKLVLLVDGQPAAHQTVSFRWMSPEIWRRMRARGLERVTVLANPPQVFPARPESVARRRADNVVVGQDIFETTEDLVTDLIVNLDNPATFDHPLDHVPGMVILDGFRQSALMVAGRRFAADIGRLQLLSCRLEFRQIAEFGPRTQCRIEKTKASLVPEQALLAFSDMRMAQGQTIAATATMDFSYADAIMESGSGFAEALRA